VAAPRIAVTTGLCASSTETMIHPLATVLRGCWLAVALAGAVARAQAPVANSIDPEPPTLVTAAPSARPERVLFDTFAAGRGHALGHTYKAVFGPEGFAYVPFLGSTAPRNFPLRFTPRSLRIGGEAIAFDAAVGAERTGTRVTFARGPLREVYDLSPTAVEQTFVVDAAGPGDVDLELDVTGELVDDPLCAGLLFANELGGVEYGAAWLVTAAGKRPIETTFADGRLRLHVPAALRDGGAVVIDPILATRAPASTTFDSLVPDTAYDATTDRWLVTWAHAFSASDHDVLAELRTGSGERIAGTIMTIDVTPVLWSAPRVANLARFDRFLVAAERTDLRPGGTRYQVWGRTVDASGATEPSAEFAISPPDPNTNQWRVDVGGDSGTGSDWLVVWQRAGDVLARLVSAAGAPHANVIAIESASLPAEWPQVSQSNGNGRTSMPRWCIVYQWQAAAGNRDVRAAMVDLGGTLLTSAALAGAAADDRSPYVSSPLVDGRTEPAFGVSYERHGAGRQMHCLVVGPWLQTVVPAVDLSARYGYTGFACRVESDGCRIAASCLQGTWQGIGTLAVVGADLVEHEVPQWVADVAAPQLASKRSGGGPTADYLLVYEASNLVPKRIGATWYRGHATSGGFATRATGCGPGLVAEGVPALGRTVRFTLGGVGNEPGFVVMALPGAGSIWCGACRLGLDLAAVLQQTPSRSLAFVVPADVRLVGLRVAVQAVAFGSGPCAPGSLRLSDTIDVAIQ
jgi:hypothetical protein